MVDYGADVGDLYIRFEHVKHSEGEATGDGKVILHYDDSGEIVAVEVMDIASI